MTERRERRPFLSTPVFAAAGRAGGLILPFFIAYFFGASAPADAFFFALSVGMFLGSLFQHTFESLLVPYLAEQKQKDPDSLPRVVRGLMVSVLPPLAVFCVVAGVGLKSFLDRFSGFEPGTSVMTAALFMEMIPFVVFYAGVSALNGVFHVQKIFWFPAASPLIRSLTVIGFLYAAHQRWGIHAAAAGFVAGECLRLIASYAGLRIAGLWDPRGKGFKGRLGDFFGQAAWQILALLGGNFVLLVNQWFASWEGTGALSLFNYGDRLYNIPYQLFLPGVLQIFLSDWSDFFYGRPVSDFWRRTGTDVRSSFWISAAVSVVFFLLRRPITLVIYSYGGGMSDRELDIVSDIFGWLMIGFSPTVVSILYVRILFILKKTRLFCALSFVKLGLAVILNYFMVDRFGVRGIAMAGSLAACVMAVIIAVYLRKHRLAASEGA